MPDQRLGSPPDDVMCAGPIPVELCGLVTLQVLSLAKNNLTGE